MGTKVRERKYEASIAKTTANASGVKRNWTAPVKKTTGTNTIQIAKVETNVGTGDLLERRPRSPE